MKLIWLDAGHGGADPGACGNGLKEKDLTLDIVLRVGPRLKAHGFNVMYSRATDVYVGLSQRAVMANQAKADYFLSVHINAGGGTGFESCVQPGCDNGETGRIRGVIHASLAEYFKQHDMPDRGHKEQDLAVCRETSMPAALIECGFIDSNDAHKLADQNFRQGVAEAIVKGICEAFNVAYKAPNQAENAPQKPSPAPATPEVEAWKVDVMQWLKTNGLIHSDHDPNATITWAEFAAVLKNLKGGN